MNMRPGVAGSRLCRGAPGLLLTLAALPAAAQVAPLTYQNLFFDQASNAHTGNYLALDAGLVYTDNASFGANGSGDTLAELGLIGNAAQSSSLFDYHVDSDIALVKYLHGSYRTEPTGYFDGGMQLKLVPELFSWLARETYTQLQIDPYSPVTPDNLENVNYLTTGPRFMLHPTLRTAATLDLEYSYMDSASQSPLYVNITNHRYGADLKIERAFSSASSLYLKGKYEKVFFNDQVDNHNFSLGEGVLGYHLQDARTDVNLSGGYTTVSVYDLLAPTPRVPVLRGPDVWAPPSDAMLLQADTALAATAQASPQAETFGGANWQITLARLITPNQRVALIASRQLVDPVAEFQLGFDSPVPTIVPQQLAVGDPYTAREYGADWRFVMARTSIDVGALYTSQRFELLPTDNRNLRDVNALFARQLTAVLNWEIGVRYDHEDVIGGPSFNATEELTDLRWQIADRVGLRFIYAHTSYNSVNTNQVGITVSYRVVGAAPSAAPSALLPISPMSTQSTPLTR
jgi:hypothetical protein